MKKHSWNLFALAIALAASTQVTAQNALDNQSERSSIESKPSIGEPVKSMRVSQLLGINVTSKGGESLGQVQDIIIDAKTGKLEFALIGKGFMAGLGERVIPLPWEAMDVRSQKEFAVNVDPKKLESAPAWSQTEMDHPDYVIRIYRFYELEPQGEMGGPGMSGQQSGKGGGSSSDELQLQPKSEDQETTPDNSTTTPDK